VRNNQDRLRAVTGGESPPVQQPQQAEPQPLQFVTPTEFVELPSRGKFYPEGHPLHNVEVIEIRHMTAKDEDILTSSALLKKGLAIDRFLQNIIVDRSVKISDLLVGDKNAVIFAARISGYGPHYEASISCPSCASTVRFSFDLEECEVMPSDVYKDYDVQLTDKGTFIIHADRTNLDVEVRLLTGKDETFLLQQAERKRKKKMPETNLTDQLRKIIVSVGGNTDPNYIESFIGHMPAADSRKIRGIYQKIVPNIDTTQDFVCSSCGHEGEVNVPFGANFFWPQQ
tara:strand:+ start:6193 stop:7047 length:855 start_codon:yes stop_codon:yes gene_type:complete